MFVYAAWAKTSLMISLESKKIFNFFQTETQVVITEEEVIDDESEVATQGDDGDAIFVDMTTSTTSTTQEGEVDDDEGEEKNIHCGQVAAFKLSCLLPWCQLKW